MRLAAATLLFLATAATAQIAGDHTVLYGPFEPAADRATAIAIAPHGMLLAWSEIDPQTKLASIRTALLNFEGRLTGEPHTLPVSRARAHATTPSVATDGSSFFVAWIERDRFSFTPREVVGLLTDATGAPLTAPSSLGLPVDGTPNVIWTGVEYRLFGSASYAISTTGAVTLVHYGDATRRVPFATPDANGWIDWSNDPRRFGCSNPFLWCGGMPPAQPAATNLDWTVVSPQWIRTGRIRESGYNTATAPAVIAEEDDLLVVWSTPQGLKAARIENGETVTTFAMSDPRASDASFAIAGPLLVFVQAGDVFGVPVHRDSFGAVFPISTGEEWDSAARVYLAGERRFLVTYVREAEGRDAFLAGRHVTLP